MLLLVPKNRTEEIFGWVKEYDLGGKLRKQILARLLGPEIISFGPVEPFALRRFGIIRGIFDRETIFMLAEQPEIIRIYSDEPMYILSQETYHYPTVPPDAVFEITYARKVKTITTTYYTKRLLGADRAHELGFYGDGVRVCAIDTGCARWHEQTGRAIFDTVMPLQRLDENGHGCVSPDTYIYVSNYGLITIEEFWKRMEQYSKYKPTLARENAYRKIVLDNGDEIIDLSETRENTYMTYSLNPNTGRIERTKIKKVVRIPIDEEIVVVKLNDGSEFKLTPWHKVFVVENDRIVEKRADELNVGDIIPFPNVELTFDMQTHLPNSQKYMSESFAWLLGMFLGDGTLVTTEVRFSPTHIELLEQIGKIAMNYGATSYRVYENEKFVVVYGKRFVELIQRVTGLRPGRKADKITIPKQIAYSKKHIIGAFIAGYLEADGNVGETEIRFSTVSRKMAEQLATLLQLLGIRTTLMCIEQKRENHSTLYQISINDIDSIWKFAKLTYKHLRSDYYRFRMETLIRNVLLRKYDRSRLYGELRLKKVVEIRREHYRGYFYDLEIDKHANYVAGRGGVMFVHNTWCVSCIGGIRARDDILSRRVGRDVWVEGMAPRCDLIAIKAMGYVLGMGATSQILMAIDRAISYRADIVNMSLGGRVQGERPEDDPYYVVLDELIQNNIVPVVAAGNEGPEEGTISSPGALPQSLTVGAYDPITGDVAEFSSRGPTPWGDIKPDTIAPGVNIHSATVYLLDFSGDNMPNRYSPLSGTSMATPHISGLVALMRQAHQVLLNKVLTVDEIKNMLKELGHAKTNVDGWGMLTWEMYEMWLSTQYSVELGE